MNQAACAGLVDSCWASRLPILRRGFPDTKARRNANRHRSASVSRGTPQALHLALGALTADAINLPISSPGSHPAVVMPPRNLRDPSIISGHPASSTQQDPPQGGNYCTSHFLRCHPSLTACLPAGHGCPSSHIARSGALVLPCLPAACRRQAPGIMPPAAATPHQKVRCTSLTPWSRAFDGSGQATSHLVLLRPTGGNKQHALRSQSCGHASTAIKHSLRSHD